MSAKLLAATVGTTFGVVRRSGEIHNAHGLGINDHLCWVFDDPECYHARVIEFFADGLDLGLRLAYFGDGPVDRLVPDLRGLDGVDELTARGALQFRSVDDVYGSGPVDPDVLFENCVAAMDGALAAGFRGLRVAADGTSQVRTAEQRDAFARWERRLDQYMVRHPVSALCAFRGEELGSNAVAEMACLHPLIRPEASPYQLFSTDTADTGDTASFAGAGLRGELDLLGLDLLTRTLNRTVGPVPAPKWVIDATGLGFIDHLNLVALDDFARRHDTTIVLQTVISGPARLATILRLNSVQVEVMT
jgi:hypothetical protein